LYLEKRNVNVVLLKFMASTIGYPLLSLRQCETDGDICLKQLCFFHEHAYPIAPPILFFFFSATWTTSPNSL